jgi:hypothetical protein
MTWSLFRRPGSAEQRSDRRAPSTPCRRRDARFRVIRVELLEDRVLLAALPFGAMPDDTGEYMLGDVHVTVVLMESDPTLTPFDNLPFPQGIGAPAENWTSDAINAIKTNVEAGMQWWVDTLDALPNVRDGLLSFTYDWTYADNPVATGYEPIARVSNDFALWMYDFLNVVGFNQTGNFSSDIRAFNNFQRQQAGADWAFTIFVVNNENDADKLFAPGGSFSRAFAFAGGRFMVVPADRPASTFAHEAGHMFWAFDEYLGTANGHTARRGYYNTPNTNHASNPAPDFVHQSSIMSNGTSLEAAWAGNVSSQSSLEMIGWRDSDGDGIFDVLDVPFTLEGLGRFDSSSNTFRFTGTSSVRTLPNLNSSGLQNDITINQIRVVEVQIDNGPWMAVQTMPSRTYQANLDLSIAVPSGGDHILRIRTHDTRTGVTSNVFEAYVDGPPQSTPAPGGVGGFVFRDDNGNGAWDAGEPPLPDFAIEILNASDEPLDLQRYVEPSEYVSGTELGAIHPEVTLTAIGVSSDVFAIPSVRVPAAGRVFGTLAGSSNIETWSSSRQFKAEFASLVSTVSLRAFAGAAGTSFARLEAYNTAGELVARVTSGGLTGTGGTTLSLSRAEADIAYIIAKGHMGTQVILDTLEWGPAASSTTNTQGGYSLAYLPPGTYKVKVTPPPGHVVTTPPDGTATIVVAAGQSLGNVNFGIQLQTVANVWHNPSHPLNVNNDGFISPLDALIVINWLNTMGGASPLPTTGNTEQNMFIDVNNDGYASPLDALLVINHLNFYGSGPVAGSGEGEALAGEAVWGTMHGGATDGDAPATVTEEGGPEGEERLAPPRTAAEYYARNPIHFLQIAGTDLPCCCGQCVGRLSSSVATGAAAGGAATDSAFAGIETALQRASPSGVLVLDTLQTRIGQATERSAAQHPQLARLRAILSDSTRPLARWQHRLEERLPLAERLQPKLDQVAAQLESTLESLAADVAGIWATEDPPL